MTSSSSRILLIEDDEKIRELIIIYLEREGYSVDFARDGIEALAKIADDYDLVIVDIMLPGLDGWTICKKIREIKDVPVLIVTARGAEHEKLFGFEMGADDYMVKPFNPLELMARVKVFLKRSYVRPVKERTNKLEFPSLSIDIDSRQVKIHGEEMVLTAREYDLLAFLARNRSRVFTREELLTKVWGFSYFGDLRTVDTYVKQLRKKLKDPTGQKYIKTVWGVGYKFEVDDDQKQLG